MTDVWTTRDLPVLRALVAHFDDPDSHAYDLPNASGLDREQVRRALIALSRADPPYFEAIKTASGEVAQVVEITERAHREVGAWPTAEGLADQLATAFAKAADAEPDSERKNRLRAVAEGVGGATRSIAIDVLTRIVERQAGLG